jgi:hypothetical protein
MRVPALLLLSAMAVSVAAMRAAPPLERQSAGELLARVRQYALQYQQQAPSFVARERYTQNITYDRGRSGHRILVADLVMVRLPGTAGWMSFRDVVEVDGRAVRDRERRLVELLQSPSSSVLAQARELAAESARFNIGRIKRTINVPDIAFPYLDATHADRITFAAQPSTKIDDIPVEVFRFKETRGPSILRQIDGTDLLAGGRVWVDAASGAVVRTELIVRDRFSNGSCVVDFQLHERMAIRVPSRMTERYRLTGETINGVATYSDYRQFTVSTSENVKKPL